MIQITKRVVAAGAMLLFACDVKDPIYDTSHPAHGMVTLTTEWSAIGQGLSAPESYMVTATRSGSATPDYTATLTGITNKLDHLFEPGDYRFLVYNTPQWIKVEGSVASVAGLDEVPMGMSRAEPGEDNPEAVVHGMPGWLFTCALDAAIQADTEHTLTAPMQQQVRQLTLTIEPAGGTADRIHVMQGVLTGVATKLDMNTGAHSAPGVIFLDFTPVTSGPDAGKWTTTVRLLGVTGERQELFVDIFFDGGEPQPLYIDSDLTKALTSFNEDKRTPLALEGQVVETPYEGGFKAVIDDWKPGKGEEIDAYM